MGGGQQDLVCPGFFPCSQLGQPLCSSQMGTIPHSPMSSHFPAACVVAPCIWEYFNFFMENIESAQK